LPCGCYRGSTESVHQFKRTRTAAGNETGHQEENDPEDKELRQQNVRQDTVRHVDAAVVLRDANIPAARECFRLQKKKKIVSGLQITASNKLT
jgi:hypothetical protein